MPDLFLPTQVQTDLLVWGLFVHVIADWFLQNEWMAQNKQNLRHPAGWVHAGVHTVGMMWIFPWYLALLIGVTHLLIDTRTPVVWWMHVVKGIPDGSPMCKELLIWMDQMFHVAVLAIAVLLFI